MKEKPISKQYFESLSPFDRGWCVYMAGKREDQPNIPDEDNPYPDGTDDHQQWDRGQQRAMLEVMDSEE